MPTEETALGLRRVDLGLLSLAVFRGVLDDPVVAALARCVRLGAKIVECDDDSPRLGRKYAEAYARFVSSLVEAEDGCLSAHVRNVVLDDENAYLRQLGAGGDVPAELEAAAARELETLGMLANLTSDELLAPVGADDERELLPRFANEPIDLAAAYAERVRNIGRTGWGMYARYNVFRVDRDQIVPVRYPDPQRLEDLVDYERQRQVILDNTRALLRGLPAANILLTGDAGTGKSSTVKAVANTLAPEGLRILEVRKEQLRDIPAILDQLTRNPLKFVIFIDDLSFSTDDDQLSLALKASSRARSRQVRQRGDLCHEQPPPPGARALQRPRRRRGAPERSPSRRSCRCRTASAFTSRSTSRTRGSTSTSSTSSRRTPASRWTTRSSTSPRSASPRGAAPGPRAAPGSLLTPSWLRPRRDRRTLWHVP